MTRLTSKAFFENVNLFLVVVGIVWSVFGRFRPNYLAIFMQRMPAIFFEPKITNFGPRFSNFLFCRNLQF